MKKIILALLLVLGCFVSYSQVQSDRFVTGKVICTQTGAGVNTFRVSCNFTDEGGLYDGTNVQVGDLLYFTDGGYGYYLPITNIVSSGVSTIVIDVNNSGSGLGAVPSTVGFISRGTNTYGFTPYTSGISNADQQINSEYNNYLLDSILYYKLVERVNGDSVPTYIPTEKQSWIVQDNDSGNVYRWNPVDSVWIPIEGLDTLNGIYSGSDTIPFGTVAYIDSTFSMIGDNGQLLLQIGDLSYSRITFDNSNLRLQYTNALVGTNKIDISSGGILLETINSSPTDIKLYGSVLFNRILTPSTISSNQNNYSPSGLTNANFVRLNSSSNINITGLGTGNGRPGRMLMLHNVGSFNITLKNQSGSSTAENRFDISDDYSLAPSDFAILQYDTLTDRWRISGTPRQYVDSLSMTNGTLRVSLFNDKVPHKEVNITENIQDIVGAMIGTTTNIAVTYNDLTGKINYVASSGGGGGGGSAIIDTFMIINDVLYLSFLLDSIPASTVDLSKYLQSIDTFGVSGGNLRISLSNDSVPALTVPITTIAPIQSLVAGNGIILSGTNTVTISAKDSLTTNELQQIDTFAINGPNITASLSLDGVPVKTINITESTQDITGAMFSSNTETGITVTYDDSDGTIDLVASDISATNEIQNIDTFSINGTTIIASLLNDGVPTKSINIANAIATAGTDSTWIKINGSYLNKRPLDNIYRTGTIGLRTTDTTGLVNLKIPSNSTKPGIFLDSTLNYWLFTPRPTTTTHSISDFAFTKRVFRSASIAGDNQVFRMGFNTGPGGNLINASRSGASIELEENYTNSLTDTSGYYEVHIPNIRYPNGDAVRSITGYLSNESINKGGYWRLNSDVLLLHSYDNTQKGWISVDHKLGYQKGITFLDTAKIVLYKSSIVGIEGRNVANTGFIQMIKTDASDRVFLGGLNETRVAAYNKFQITNSGLLFNESGTITIGDPTYSRSNLVIDAFSTLALAIKTSTQTSPWYHRLYDTHYVIRTPSGNDVLDLHEDAPNVTIATNSSGNVGLLTASPQARLHINTANGATQEMLRFQNSVETMGVFVSNATPESAITSTPGSLALTEISSNGELYLKYTGTGNTGWKKVYHEGNLPSTTTLYTGDGTTTDRTVEINGYLNFYDTDDDGELNVTIGSLSNGNLIVNGNESKITFNNLAGLSTVAVDGSGVEISTNVGTRNIFVNSAGYVQFDMDSIIFNTGIEAVDVGKGILSITSGGTVQRIVGAETGHTLIWDDVEGQWESAPLPSSSGGNGIYGGDGNIPAGGSQVLMDTIGETVRFVMNTGNTTLREMLRLETVQNAFTRFFVLKGPSDSLRVFRASAGREYTFQTYGGTCFTMSTDSIIKLVGDSLLIVENIAPVSGNKIKFLFGLTNNYYAKRIEALNNNEIMLSNGVDWVRTDLSTAVSGAGFFLQNGNSFGSSAVLGTNDNNSLSFEVNNVTGLSLNTDYSLTATASVANTNTAADRFVIRTNSSGTPAASFGGGILFQGESSTTDNRDMARISSVWTTATDAGRTSNVIFSAVSSGSFSNIFTIRGLNGDVQVGSVNAATYGSSGITTATSFTVGNSSSGLTIGGNSGTVTISNNSTNNINIWNTGNLTASSSGIVFGGATSFTQTSGTRNYIDNTWSFAPTSGTAVHNQFVFSGTFNQTGGANGITRGIYLNQTLTAVADMRLIEIAANNSNAKGIYQTGSSTTNNFVGKTGFGATTTPDDAVEITGNLELLSAGNKLKIATGSNASVGKSAAMTAGTITISTTAVTANSIILLTHADSSGTIGELSVGTITAGTSFVINSSSATDTSAVNWLIIN